MAEIIDPLILETRFIMLEISVELNQKKKNQRRIKFIMAKYTLIMIL